jgi:diguanylate cyclase
MLPRTEARPVSERPIAERGAFIVKKINVSSSTTQLLSIQTASVSAGYFRSQFNELIVGAAVFLSASSAILLTLTPGGIALLWPASAIAGALLIRLPKIRWSLMLACVVVGLMAANMLVAHRPAHAAAVLTSVNLVEIALMVAAFRFVWRFPYPDITVSDSAFMVAIFGIAIPSVATVFGGIALHVLYDSTWSQGSLQWWSSHVVGACLLGPPIILFSHAGFRRLLGRRFVVQNALSVIAGLLGCYLAIRFVRFPFVSIGLILMVAAFRLGGLGTSLMSLASALVITNLWLLGIVRLDSMPPHLRARR